MINKKYVFMIAFVNLIVFATASLNFKNQDLQQQCVDPTNRLDTMMYQLKQFAEKATQKVTNVAQEATDNAVKAIEHQFNELGKNVQQCAEFYKQKMKKLLDLLILFVKHPVFVTVHSVAMILEALIKTVVYITKPILDELSNAKNWSKDKLHKYMPNTLEMIEIIVSKLQLKASQWTKAMIETFTKFVMPLMKLLQLQAKLVSECVMKIMKKIPVGKTGVTMFLAVFAGFSTQSVLTKQEKKIKEVTQHDKQVTIDDITGIFNFQNMMENPSTQNQAYKDFVAAQKIEFEKIEQTNEFQRSKTENAEMLKLTAQGQTEQEKQDIYSKHINDEQFKNLKKNDENFKKLKALLENQENNDLTTPNEQAQKESKIMQERLNEYHTDEERKEEYNKLIDEKEFENLKKHQDSVTNLWDELQKNMPQKEGNEEDENTKKFKDAFNRMKKRMEGYWKKHKNL